jgi:hypothetical protein
MPVTARAERPPAALVKAVIRTRAPAAHPQADSGVSPDALKVAKVELGKLARVREVVVENPAVRAGKAALREAPAAKRAAVREVLGESAALEQAAALGEAAVLGEAAALAPASPATRRAVPVRCAARETRSRRAVWQLPPPAVSGPI